MSKTKKQITASKLANTDQAVIDQRLTDLDYRLLGLMVSLADGATGIVKRRQTELAKLLGRARRSIQRCLDHLVASNTSNRSVRRAKELSGPTM